MIPFIIGHAYYLSLSFHLCPIPLCKSEIKNYITPSERRQKYIKQNVGCLLWSPAQDIHFPLLHSMELHTSNLGFPVSLPNVVQTITLIWLMSSAFLSCLVVLSMILELIHIPLTASQSHARRALFVMVLPSGWQYLVKTCFKWIWD